jgi:glycosyltransferase involved in cell wall biosynthesis
MDHIPLISIIIPTYNRPNWLKQAIVSPLGPTHIPVEVVVVDDGSTNTIPDIYGYCFIWKSGYVKIEPGWVGMRIEWSLHNAVG